MVTTNPFKIDLDLSTPEGRKLFGKATEGLEEKYDLNPENAKAFIDDVHTASKKFCWGEVICKMYVDKDDTNITAHMFKDMAKLTTDHVLLNAYATWTTGIYTTRIVDDNCQYDFLLQRRVRSSMIAMWLQESLTRAALKKVMLKRALFEFENTDGTVEMDGPLMFKVIYDMIKPSTRAGYVTIKQKLAKYNLKDFEFNVPDMLSSMQHDYDDILVQGGTHDDLILNVFAALSTVDNDEFQRFVSDKLSFYQLGNDLTADSLATEAITLYNNMISANTWVKKHKAAKGSDDKEHSKQLITLATQLAQAQEQIKSLQLKDTSSPNTKKSSSIIADWRMKKGEDHVFRDGKDWWWCPHHVSDRFNGLYVTHKPSEHDAWKAGQRRRGRKFGDDASKKETSEPKLELKDNLQKILYASTMDASQVHEIIEKLSEDF